MATIGWTDSLVLGIDEIDADHRQLITCYNDLLAACAAGVEASDFNDALAKLIAHTAYHFKHEEALMERSGYVDLDAHRVEHEVLHSSVRMLHKKTISENSRAMNSYALTFLWSWLVDHIVDADKRFAGFLLYQADEGLCLPASCSTESSAP